MRTTLSPDEERSLITAMKVAYYNDFYRKGLISAEQLETLISMQKR
ncbi:MAG: hypothetical protein ILP19_07380 [Oscillospiraceae bacterium]|nr:hypothetical protein [Oscillospiraceae bacterium]